MGLGDAYVIPTKIGRPDVIFRCAWKSHQNRLHSDPSASWNQFEMIKTVQDAFSEPNGIKYKKSGSTKRWGGCGAPGTRVPCRRECDVELAAALEDSLAGSCELNLWRSMSRELPS